jgi:hypothetical protein
MQICFIIGKPRSGTTVFKEMLATHPAFINVGEVFNEINEWSFLAFLRALVKEDADWLLPSRCVNAFISYIDACVQKALFYNPQSTILVLDVKYDQSHLVYDAWRDINAMPYLFELMRKRGWDVVDIHRDRILDMIVSNEVAISTGVYHQNTGDLPRQLVQVEINTAELISIVASIRESYQRVEAFFAGYDRYLKLSYEDMFDAQTGAFKTDILESLANFFGVANRFDPHPKLQKLLIGDPLRYVTNAEEVLLAIASVE